MLKLFINPNAYRLSPDTSYCESTGVNLLCINNDFRCVFRTKFFVMDVKPVCKHCFEKFPGELQKRLKKASDAGLG